MRWTGVLWGAAQRGAGFGTAAASGGARPTLVDSHIALFLKTLQTECPAALPRTSGNALLAYCAAMGDDVMAGRLEIPTSKDGLEVQEGRLAASVAGQRWLKAAHVLRGLAAPGRLSSDRWAELAARLVDSGASVEAAERVRDAGLRSGIPAQDLGPVLAASARTIADVSGSLDGNEAPDGIMRVARALVRVARDSAPLTLDERAEARALAESLWAKLVQAVDSGLIFPKSFLQGARLLMLEYWVVGAGRLDLALAGCTQAAAAIGPEYQPELAEIRLECHAAFLESSQRRFLHAPGPRARRIATRLDALKARDAVLGFCASSPKALLVALRVDAAIAADDESLRPEELIGRYLPLGLVPSAAAWHAVLWARARQAALTDTARAKRVDACIALAHQMQTQHGVCVDSETTAALLAACRPAAADSRGLVDPRAWTLASDAQRDGRALDPAVAAQLLPLLIMSGRLQEAEEFLELLAVPRAVSLWNAILAECRHSRAAARWGVTFVCRKMAADRLPVNPDGPGICVPCQRPTATSETWQYLIQCAQRLRDRALAHELAAEAVQQGIVLNSASTRALECADSFEKCSTGPVADLKVEGG